jgi:hypothetical protein
MPFCPTEQRLGRNADFIGAEVGNRVVITNPSDRRNGEACETNTRERRVEWQHAVTVFVELKPKWRRPNVPPFSCGTAGLYRTTHKDCCRRSVSCNGMLDTTNLWPRHRPQRWSVLRPAFASLREARAPASRPTPHEPPSAARWPSAASGRDIAGVTFEPRANRRCRLESAERTSTSRAARVSNHLHHRTSRGAMRTQTQNLSPERRRAHSRVRIRRRKVPQHAGHQTAGARGLPTGPRPTETSRTPRVTSQADCDDRPPPPPMSVRSLAGRGP